MPIVSSKKKTNEAVKIIRKFQTGEQKPLSLGDEPLMKWIEEIMVAGPLPGSIITFAGLSNHGKTHLMQRIENNLLKYNNPDDIVLLRCNWESNVYKLLLRKIKQETGMRIKDVLLKEPEGEQLRKIQEICDEERKEGIFYFEESVTPEEFYKAVSDFIKLHPNKKIVITIDHVGLVKGREKASIDALFEMMNKLKKEHPYVVFIALMQLERSKLLSRLGEHARESPNRGDFYGSDQLFQVSDGVFVVYNPFREGAQDKYMVFTDDRYTYIDDDFKTTKGKWSYFDPHGNIFYHALKARDIDDLENFKDVFVERLFYRRSQENKPEPERSEEEINDILSS